MAAKTELEIQSLNGNIVLTNFMNVEEGQGMDPANPQFTQKVFAHSLLKAGGTLALEDFKLREVVFPLLLNAATKTALTVFVKEINTAINTAGCTVRWKDEGATANTYFTLASGQLDPEFGFRKGEHNWLNAKLRLFAQPLATANPLSAPSVAYQECTPKAGTATAASAPFSVFSAASAVGGDAPALFKGVFNPGNVLVGNYYFAVGVLPNASYTPWWPAASQSVPGWVQGASPAGLGYLTGGNQTIQSFAEPGGVEGTAKGGPKVYLGTNRLLAFARRFNNASSAIFETQVADNINVIANATATVPGSSGVYPWSVLDMGTFNFPTGLEGLSQLKLEIRVPSGTMQLYGLGLMPDQSSVWYNAGTRVENPGYFLVDGLLNVARAERYLVTGLARGAIPAIPASATAPSFVAFAFGPQESASRFPVIKWAEAEAIPRYRYVV